MGLVVDKGLSGSGRRQMVKWVCWEGGQRVRC